MKLLKRLKKNAGCCIPVRSSYHPTLADFPHPIYHLPAIGAPRKTSTPIDQPTNTPAERYTKRSTPRTLSSLGHAPPRAITPVSNPPLKPARKTPRLQKKSDPHQQKKKTIIEPVRMDLGPLLPLEEFLAAPRVCDVDCIVCALAKPELRTRHHCCRYTPL